MQLGKIGSNLNQIAKHLNSGGSYFSVYSDVKEAVKELLDLKFKILPALEDVAELVDGIDLHVLIVPEPIELGAVYIIMGIKIILGNTPLLHGLPQTVVCYHFHPPVALF